MMDAEDIYVSLSLILIRFIGELNWNYRHRHPIKHHWRNELFAWPTACPYLVARPPTTGLEVNNSIDELEHP